MEGYRSGHNEAVLKTVWVQAHGGSNPSLSAIKKDRFSCLFLWLKELVFELKFARKFYSALASYVVQRSSIPHSLPTIT